jgi:hypothetical protein
VPAADGPYGPWLVSFRGVSGSDHPVDQPAVYQLMVELLRCRDRLAPQLPQFNERRLPRPLLVGEDPAGFYDAVRLLMDEVHDAYVREYGARRSWRRAGSEADAVALLQAPHVEVFDAEPDDWTSPSALDYDEGPSRAVARAYRRECRWDTAPGPPSRDYVWVCVHEPRSCIYDEDAQNRHIDGSLIGFAVVADRDEDGEPESLAHLWVARQSRLAGHATLLLTEAERRFPKLGTVEHPVTTDGAAFLAARSPRLTSAMTGS